VFRRKLMMRVTTLYVILVLISGIVLFGPFQSQVMAQDTSSLGEKISSDGLDVLFCSYFGGDNEEWSNDVCFTDDGGFLLSGMSRSDDLPVQNAYQSEYAGDGDAFLVKVSSQFQVEFYTYFGGTGHEEPMALTIDNDGNIILAGGTSSDDLTVLDPLQENLNGTSDAFLAKFSPSGTLLFSTYLGGSDFDRIEDIFISTSGDYVVVGPTWSTDFYTSPGSHQKTFGGGDSDVFITSISNDGQSIQFSTYFGNTTNDDAWAIGSDSTGDVIIVGMTDGDAIATDSAYQQTYGGGDTDCFVAKFTHNCSSLKWSTLLGGNGWEFGDQVEFDSDDNIVASGYTGSSDFPLVNQLYNDTPGYDAFFAKLDADGENLLMSSYLGGSLEDRSYAMEVLSDESILITSPTGSSDMPVENSFLNYSGGYDGYIALIDEETPELLFGSYYGGSSNDYVLGMSVYGESMIAVIGYTYSNDLPTAYAIQSEYGGSSDTMVWVFGFSDGTTPPVPNGLPDFILGPSILVVVVVVLVALIVVSIRRRT
jgi:hypothetical protein